MDVMSDDPLIYGPPTFFIGPPGADPDELGDPRDLDSGWDLLSPTCPDVLADDLPDWPS